MSRVSLVNHCAKDLSRQETAQLGSSKQFVQVTGGHHFASQTILLFVLLCTCKKYVLSGLVVDSEETKPCNFVNILLNICCFYSLNNQSIFFGLL